MKYSDIDEIQKNKTNSSSLSLFHLNTSSLNKDVDDFEYLLKTTNQTFHIIAVRESRILKSKKIRKVLIYQIMLWHILYINDQSSYKPKTDMNRCKSYELESTFIEIINPKANIKVS